MEKSHDFAEQAKGTSLEGATKHEKQVGIDFRGRGWDAAWDIFAGST